MFLFHWFLNLAQRLKNNYSFNFLFRSLVLICIDMTPLQILKSDFVTQYGILNDPFISYSTL